MRVLALIVAFALGNVVGLGSAAAEKVKSNQSTKLFSRPGEQAKVLLTVKSGQSMTLLSKDGRWLKVRVQGRTGYVPRSKVDMGDDDFARNTRSRPFVQGRGKKRGFGGDAAPDDRVGADAMGDTDSGDSGGDEDEEEEDEPKPKKAAVKAKPAAKDEDEDEDEEETPKAKKPAPKAVTKGKPAAKDEDEDEEEEDEEKPAAKPAAKKPAAKVEDEEEEEDEGDTKAAKKGKGNDDEDEDAKKKEDEPEEDKRRQVRVTKKVAVRDKPDEESDESFVVRPTDTLFPGETEGSWTFVENPEGDGGWVQSDLLESGGGGGGKRTIDVRARTGILIIQQAMRTSGSNVNNVPDNYNTATSAITLALGGGIIIPRGKKMLLGGEFTYDMSKTLLGGVFFDPDGKMGSAPGVNIGITVHNVNARGLIGVDFHKKSGMALFARLGYRYQGFLITDVASMTANPAQLPSEVVKGPTVGGALAIPMLTDKIGLRFSLDALLFGGSVTQTRGLEDGASPAVKAIVLGAVLNYRLGKSLDLQATYDLNYMGIDFGAPLAASTRVHMGTNVARADIFHGVTIGIAKPF